MIDLHMDELTSADVDGVIEELDIEFVHIETDMKGLQYLLRFFDGWLAVPRFSGSSIQQVGTSRVGTLGVHPDGIGITITAWKGHANSMRFMDNNAVLEEIVNYT